MSEEVWSVITMRPSWVTAEELGQPGHVRQCRVLARAKSRAAFARKLIEAGVDHRSPSAVSAWVRDFGGPSRNDEDVANVQGDSVYVRALDGRSSYVPYAEADR